MTDTRNAAFDRIQRAVLVGLLVVILLTILSPFGWNFLLPHLAAMVIDLWGGITTTMRWLYDAVIAPVLAVFA